MTARDWVLAAVGVCGIVILHVVVGKLRNARLEDLAEGKASGLISPSQIQPIPELKENLYAPAKAATPTPPLASC